VTEPPEVSPPGCVPLEQPVKLPRVKTEADSTAAAMGVRTAVRRRTRMLFILAILSTELSTELT
jgi:hypothetical protein